MITTFDHIASEKLASLLCEIDALVADGSIKVGVLGLSPDSAKMCKKFWQCLEGLGEETIRADITDAGLHLKKEIKE